MRVRPHFECKHHPFNLLRDNFGAENREILFGRKNNEKFWVNPKFWVGWGGEIFRGWMGRGFNGVGTTIVTKCNVRF